MKRLVLDSAAKSDLRNAKRYYEEQRPGLGKEFLNEAQNQLQRIGLFPLTAPKVYEGIRRARVKRFPFDIYYCTRDEEIVIIAVMHRRRHPDSWKDRL